jgi:hypothetical protein
LLSGKLFFRRGALHFIDGHSGESSGVARLDKNGTTIKFRKKDQVAKEGKPLCPFRKAFDDFCLKMYIIITGSQ